MTKENCLNCDHEQAINKNNIYKDELGKFTVCKKCDSSYDIN